MNQRILFLAGFPMLWLMIWGLFAVVSMGTRPALPLFELPLLAQAWDMWHRGLLIFPGMAGDDGGVVYPLYLWFMNATWAVFGVSDVWPRLLPSALGFASTLMIAALARALWPGWSGLGVLSASMAMGMVGWTVSVGLSGQAALMTFCVLIALYGLVASWRRGTWDGVILLGIGIGLGFLTDGYAILAHVLPVTLLTPIWAPALGWRDNAGEEDKAVTWRHWYGRLAISLAIGLMVVAGWIVPQALDGGVSVLLKVFIAPITTMLSGDQSWAQRWWLYLVLLAFFLLPWLVWPPTWRAMGGLWSMIKDGGGRFCLIWLLPGVALFAVLPGSRPLDVMHHATPLAMIAAYLLYLRIDPELARQETERRFGNGEATLGILVALIGLALIIAPLAGGLATLPWWVEGLSGAWGGVLILVGAVAAYAAPRMLIFRAALVTCQMALVVLIGMMAVSPLLKEQADTAPAATHIRQLLDREAAVAFVGPYNHGFDFPARLEAPMEVLDPGDSIGVVAWAAGHPSGEIAVVARELPPGERAAAVFPYLGQYLVFWPAESVSLQPDLVMEQFGSHADSASGDMQ